MTLLLVFSVTLFVAVLLSESFHRTILSAAVLFLLVGLLIGPSGGAFISLSVEDYTVRRTSEWALVTILFRDALQVGWHDLRATWRLPGRALLLGLPLTVVGIAVTARLLLGLQWTPAFLVGAILSPTDPVFASAIVGRQEIPARVRQLLNVESGLNDGLALPLVIVFMAIGGGGQAPFGSALGRAFEGVALGASLGFVSGWSRNVPIFAVSTGAAPLHGVSVLLMTYAAASVLDVNAFLAAFSAGISFASACPEGADEFAHFGESVSQLLKLAAVFVFAVMLSGHDWHLPWVDYLFAGIVLTFVRFAAIELSVLRSGLTRAERLTAAWFGPKGFASVVYGLALLRSSVPSRYQLFELVALVIVISMVLHSSTDVPVATYFARAAQADAGHVRPQDQIPDAANERRTAR